MKSIRTTLIAMTIAAATLMFVREAGAEEVTIASCTPTDPGGDQISRAFYFADFPGNNLGTVTVGLSGTVGGYVFTLTARANSFDGPVIGTAQAGAAITGTMAPIVFDFGGAPVVPGTTVTFKITQTNDAGASPVVYESTGTSPCPITETNDSTPPLDSNRRPNVGAIITTRAPSIASLTPPQGPPAGGTLVTVNGTHLFAGGMLAFGDASVPLGAVADGGATGEVTTPANALGLVDVVLTTKYSNDAGVDASATSIYDAGFLYANAPPDSGPTSSSSSSGSSGSSGTSSSSSSSSTSSSGASSNVDGGTEPVPNADDAGGCSVPGGSAPPFAAIAAAAMAALAVLRIARRKRR